MNVEYPPQILDNTKRRLYFDLGVKQFLASDRTKSGLGLFEGKLFKDTPYERYHEERRGKLDWNIEAVRKFYANQPDYVEEDHYNLAYNWGWAAAYDAYYKDLYKVEEFKVKLKALLKEYAVELEYETIIFIGGSVQYNANILLNEEEH